MPVYVLLTYDVYGGYDHTEVETTVLGVYPTREDAYKGLAEHLMAITEGSKIVVPKGEYEIVETHWHAPKGVGEK